MPKFPFDIEELPERIAASIQRIKDRICSSCFLGTRYDYRGENGKIYSKCSICGHTKEKS